MGAARQSPGRVPSFITQIPFEINDEPSISLQNTSIKTALIEWWSAALLEPLMLSCREMVNVLDSEQTPHAIAIDISNNAVDINDFLEALKARLNITKTIVDFSDTIVRDPLPKDHMYIMSHEIQQEKIVTSLKTMIQNYGYSLEQVRDALESIEKANDNNDDQDEI